MANSKQAPFEWTDELVKQYLANFFSQSLLAIDKIGKGEKPDHITSIEEFKSLHTSKNNSEGEGKGWEIVEYSLDGFMGMVNDIRFIRQPDGRFLCFDCRVPECRDKLIPETELIKFKHIIASVKRLSDGEVFSLGDIVDWPHSSAWTITEFVIYKGNMFANEKSGAYGADIRFISKVKPTPLFKDLLGNEIFEGDGLWALHEDNWLVHEIGEARGVPCSSGLKYFKNLTDVDNFILENKPVLSYRDVINVFTVFENLDAEVLWPNYESKLKQLVKDKLKQ